MDQEFLEEIKTLTWEKAEGFKEYAIYFHNHKNKTNFNSIDTKKINNIDHQGHQDHTYAKSLSK